MQIAEVCSFLKPELQCCPCARHKRYLLRSLQIHTRRMSSEGLTSVVDDEEFQVILTGRANNVHEVTKYRSKSTGLEVVHANIEGPIVNGYIVLATKAEDDAGLPHTLEHLVFMGSEEYPYKGVLDVLANKCYASGTNAWTDVDHTCYTMTTAGSEGFCQLLPIYMDHIFYPILSESAYKTEVHHTTGAGLDSGVVYAELQATENSAEDKSSTELVRQIYPKNSGYHYQTGGMCKDVRETCNNDRVQEFHKKFYNSRNTCLIVCGMVNPKDIFKALAPIIKKLKSRGVIDSWTKPWLDDVPEIPAAVEKTFKFPSDEEDECLVTVGFRGPSAINEIEEVAALRLLFEYLTDSSVGPFQLEFVENDKPVCSGVAYSEMENSRTTFYFEFEAVPEEDLKKVLPTMKKTLMAQIKKFDIARMHDVIQKNYQEELSSMENTPNNSVAYAVIGDFLYGSDDKAVFDKRINSSSTIISFKDKPASFWTEMIQQRILNQKWVTLIAKPSREAYKAFSKEEEARVQDRIARLGTPGLEKLNYELEEAVKTNATPTPSTVLEDVPVPSIESIHSHSIVRHQNPDWASDVKCNLFVDDIKSNFVYVSVIMDTSSLTMQQKKYLPLLRELLVESPVVDDTDSTKLVSFEDVVANLERTWLSYGCSVGIDGGGRFKCGSFSHTFVFNNQMELNKIEDGFRWIRKLLWDTQWTADRMKVVANKMAGDVGQLKRKGTRMVHTLLKDIMYKSDSNVKTSSLIRQQAFLKELAKSLPRGEKKAKEVLESIRAIFLKPENMMVHVACSLSKLQEKAGSLSSAKDLGELFTKTFSFPSDAVSSKRIPNEPDTIWMLDMDTFKKQPAQFILGLGSEDSAHLDMVAPGPHSYSDEDLPVLLTAMQYFCQTEGPFYQSIRGSGYAYGFFMDTKCSEGLIYFNLYRCTDVINAFKAAQDTVVAHLDGSIEFTEEYLSSAKSSLIFEHIEGEKTPLALASSSLCCYFRDVPQEHTRMMIAKISAVKLEQLKPIVEKYLRPLFFQEFAASVVCQSDKVSAITEGFAKLNKKLTIIPGMGNSFLQKWD